MSCEEDTPNHLVWICLYRTKLIVSHTYLRIAPISNKGPRCQHLHRINPTRPLSRSVRDNMHQLRPSRTYRTNQPIAKLRRMSRWRRLHLLGVWLDIRVGSSDFSVSTCVSCKKYLEQGHEELAVSGHPCCALCIPCYVLYVLAHGKSPGTPQCI